MRRHNEVGYHWLSSIGVLEQSLASILTQIHVDFHKYLRLLLSFCLLVWVPSFCAVHVIISRLFRILLAILPNVYDMYDLRCCIYLHELLGLLILSSHTSMFNVHPSGFILAPSFGPCRLSLSVPICPTTSTRPSFGARSVLAH